VNALEIKARAYLALVIFVSRSINSDYPSVRFTRPYTQFIEPSTKSLHSIPPIQSTLNINATFDNANTTCQGKVPKSSIRGYLVISENLKGLRLGQAGRRKHMH
jgi:hypothetical protein